MQRRNASRRSATAESTGRRDGLGPRMRPTAREPSARRAGSTVSVFVSARPGVLRECRLGRWPVPGPPPQAGRADAGVAGLTRRSRIQGPEATVAARYDSGMPRPTRGSYRATPIGRLNEPKRRVSLARLRLKPRPLSVRSCTRAASGPRPTDSPSSPARYGLTARPYHRTNVRFSLTAAGGLPIVARCPSCCSSATARPASAPTTTTGCRRPDNARRGWSADSWPNAAARRRRADGRHAASTPHRRAGLGHWDSAPTLTTDPGFAEYDAGAVHGLSARRLEADAGLAARRGNHPRSAAVPEDLRGRDPGLDRRCAAGRGGGRALGRVPGGAGGAGSAPPRAAAERPRRRVLQGPIAVAVAAATDAGPARTLEFNWSIRNGAVSTLRSTRTGWRLTGFNDISPSTPRAARAGHLSLTMTADAASEPVPSLPPRSATN